MPKAFVWFELFHFEVRAQFQIDVCHICLLLLITGDSIWPWGRADLQTYKYKPILWMMMMNSPRAEEIGN